MLLVFTLLLGKNRSGDGGGLSLSVFPATAVSGSRSEVLVRYWGSFVDFRRTFPNSWAFVRDREVLPREASVALVRVDDLPDRELTLVVAVNDGAKACASICEPSRRCSLAEIDALLLRKFRVIGLVVYDGTITVVGAGLEEFELEID